MTVKGKEKDLGLWIRVNANLADDDEVRAFAADILPRQPKWLAVACACGLLETLWGQVAQRREDGIIGSCDDEQIEAWAKWGGKGGVFASAFRRRFLDSNGRILLWEEYQGVLLQKRRRDRERLRLSRERRATVPRASRDGRANVDRPSRVDGNCLTTSFRSQLGRTASTFAVDNSADVTPNSAVSAEPTLLRSVIAGFRAFAGGQTTEGA